MTSLSNSIKSYVCQTTKTVLLASVKVEKRLRESTSFRGSTKSQDMAWFSFLPRNPGFQIMFALKNGAFPCVPISHEGLF